MSTCLLVGTPVRLADGQTRAIEDLRSGDEIASLEIAGLERDVPQHAQYDWLSTTLGGATPTTATVGSVRIGTHDGVVVLNGRVRATHEHPFLIRRAGEVGFCSAEFIREGDELLNFKLDAERVDTIERVDGRVSTVSIHVPGTNVYLAGGVWVHNDITLGTVGSTSGSGGSSGSGGGGGPSLMSTPSQKSSGSSSFGSSSSGSGGSGSVGSGPETGLNP